MKNLTIKIVLFALFTACFLAACGDAAKETGDTREKMTEEDTGLPDTKISIPKTLVGEEVADIPADTTPEETLPGSETVPGNETPDTVTYRLTATEQDEILKGLAEDISNSIATILADKEYYPSVTDIQANEDFTEFVISVNSAQLNLYETTLLMSFITIGDKYQIYSGVPSEAVLTTVIYENTETGTELARSDSHAVE